ncbi:ABC transporter ATP-binding/permease protein [bacterium HR36]|nr:ABC transporter ATP-binding/permease protein [bacterium HR36]
MSTAKRQWIIGRAPDCDIVVDHPQVSARHCRLTRTEAGWVLADLGSTNGTYVNGVRIRGLVTVRPSDQILLANAVPLPWSRVFPQATGEGIAAAASGDAGNVARLAATQRPPVGPSAAPGSAVDAAAAGRVIRIGRAPDNDVVLDHPTVSRYHARLVQLADGSMYIEDLQSFNGTAVGHVYQRVQRAAVSPQDVVYLGTYRVPVAQLLQGRRVQGWVQPQGGPLLLGRQQIGADPWLGRQAAQLVQQGNQFLLQAQGAAPGVFVNGRPLHGQIVLQPGDQVQVGTQCLRIRPDGQLEQWNYRERLVVEARQVGVCVGRKWLIRDISLTLFPRELIALMGPSGAGKTTLLMCLCGYLRPSQGDVLFNGESLYDNYARFSPFMGYVPQDDIMHRELTVREALYYSARLRLPTDYSDAEIHQRIEAVIAQLGLEGCEDVLIGSPERKGISGGQRKRVNLAMELLTDPLVLFLDEPTSGLSSEDALLVVEALRRLADSGKIIVVTIHQPGLDVYRLFDHLILIGKDRNSPEPGQLVYYGPAYPDAVHFFNPQGIPNLKPGADPLPDEVLRGLNRRPASHWVQCYRQSKYYRDFVENRRLSSDNQRVAQPRQSARPAVSLRPPGWIQLWTLMRRCFRVKWRDTWGSTILLAQAPVVALLVVLVLARSASSSDPQDYLQAKPQTIFLAGLAALWFGCSNSVREIVGEWAIFHRERMVGLRLWSYLLSKLTILGGLCIVQCLVLLVLISLYCNWKASLSAMYAFTLTAALAGLAIGLCISAPARTSEMAVALLPLVLIPMVVLSGAMFPIRKMHDAMQAVCRIMPTRWAYEGMVVLEADAMERDREKSGARRPAVTNAQGQVSGLPVVPPPDIAERHFPREMRHRPGESFTWLAVLTAIYGGSVFAILRLRAGS